MTSPSHQKHILETASLKEPRRCVRPWEAPLTFQHSGRSSQPPTCRHEWGHQDALPNTQASETKDRAGQDFPLNMYPPRCDKGWRYSSCQEVSGYIQERHINPSPFGRDGLRLLLMKSQCLEQGFARGTRAGSAITQSHTQRGLSLGRGTGRSTEVLCSPKRGVQPLHGVADGPQSGDDHASPRENRGKYSQEVLSWMPDTDNGPKKKKNHSKKKKSKRVETI